jgi:hypothetical protein
VITRSREPREARHVFVREDVQHSGRASASAVSSRVICPRATALDATQPYARLETLYSAAYFAAPVTLARPSTRLIGFPMYVVVMELRLAFGVSRSTSPYVRSKL